MALFWGTIIIGCVLFFGSVIIIVSIYEWAERRC
jgi:hypothetical protein